MNKNNLTTFFLTSITFGLLSPMSFAASCPASSTNVSNISSCTVEGSGSDIKLNFISGFVSSTATSPVGGNNGKTIGEQRRLAFIKAAEIISYQVVSPQVIEVDARFSDLACDRDSAVLGSAGATNSIAFEMSDNIANVELDTFYPVALANALSNKDLSVDKNGNFSDIQAEFNSRLGAFNCLNGGGWYYGFDDNSVKLTSFLTVLLHEVTHGLGFSSLFDPITGKKPAIYDPNTKLKIADLDDIFSNFLYIKSEDKTFNELGTSVTDNTKRKNAIISENDLYWNGLNANNLSISKIKTGFSDNDSNTEFTTGDRIQMYSPGTLEQGSSVSHFDKKVSPDELMEPNLTINKCDLGLALGVLKDIGWSTITVTNDSFYLNIDCKNINNGDTFNSNFNGDLIKITPVSDSSSYTYSLTYEGNPADDLIEAKSNGLFINPKDTGEFAGVYTLTIGNGNDPDVIITINRPLRLVWSSDALLNNEKYTLKIEGGAAGSTYDLTQSHTGIIHFLNQDNQKVSSISASNDPANSNPARLNITSQNVNYPLTVETTVKSQSNTYPNVSSDITIYPSILHSFTVTDETSSAINNASIIIDNSSLIQQVGIDTVLSTNSLGKLSFYLPNTADTFSVTIIKAGYNNKRLQINATNTTHAVTLLSSLRNTSEPTTPKFGSGGGGSMPLWFLMLSGLFLLRRPRLLSH
jgi:hypothetical protein